jgi:FdhE protein
MSGVRQGIGQPVPVILPVPSVVFAGRAGRLDALADGHPMADWLRFMAHLARAQHAAVAELPPPDPLPAIEGEPPLAYASHDRAPYWRAALAAILRAMAAMQAPDQAHTAMRMLHSRSPCDLDEVAASYLHGDISPDRRGEAVFVAAALAVYFAHRAAALPAAEVHLLAQRGRCPACGAAPVAGVVMAAGQAPGARYLHCGLCAAAWNHVRAVCTGCGGSRGLALHGIEGGDGTVQAETCEDCRGYAKVLYQAKDMGVEPMADDLASLGLDMLVSEAGYRRHAPNPLVIGEP